MMLTKEERSKIGRRSRRLGSQFELIVRRDLESKGFIVSKWMNNIDNGKLIPARPSRFRLSSTGFPDYISITPLKDFFDVTFCEVKINGKLDKIEKEKARWYLKNRYCKNFLIASKLKVDGKVKVRYEEFK